MNKMIIYPPDPGNDEEDETDETPPGWKIE